MLVHMCEKFSQRPSDYLFNDLVSCAHTRLVMDMTAFNVWAKWREEQEKKHEREIERKARLANASR